MFTAMSPLEIGILIAIGAILTIILVIYALKKTGKIKPKKKETDDGNEHIEM